MPAKALEVGTLVKFGKWRRTLAREYSQNQGVTAKQKKREALCVIVKYTVTGSRQMVRIKLTTSGSMVVTVVLTYLRIKYIRQMTNNVFLR